MIDMEPHYYLALEINDEGDTTEEELLSNPYNALTLQIGGPTYQHARSRWYW